MVPNGGELLLILVIAVLVIGPRQLPEYAAKFRDLIRSLRSYADGAQRQLKEELGPAYEDIDWKQLDPRQYDPRRIVREAWASEGDQAGSDIDPPASESDRPSDPVRARIERSLRDPALPTPFDTDAT